MGSRSIIAVALAMGITAGPALAQSKNERLDMLESRMSAVERQLENQGLVEMSRQIEVLTDEVRKLRGDIDTMQRDLERARSQQKDQYVDLDTRHRIAIAFAAYEAANVTGVPIEDKDPDTYIRDNS